MPSPAIEKGHPKYGGRERGAQNKKTLERAVMLKNQRIAAKIEARSEKISDERALEAERQLAEYRLATRPLAKEQLDSLMTIFINMAIRYQPKAETPTEQLLPEIIDQFERWAKNAMEAARLLAPYQSPTMKAIYVDKAPETGRKSTKFTLTIFETQRDGGTKLIEHQGPTNGSGQGEDNGAK